MSSTEVGVSINVDARPLLEEGEGRKEEGVNVVGDIAGMIPSLSFSLTPLDFQSGACTYSVLIFFTKMCYSSYRSAFLTISFVCLPPSFLHFTSTRTHSSPASNDVTVWKVR